MQPWGGLAERKLEPASCPSYTLPSGLWYLTGVRGLLLRRLGERSLGWKEKPSLMLSRTEGATYVKPWGGGRGRAKAEPDDTQCPPLLCHNPARAPITLRPPRTSPGRPGLRSH